MGLVAPDGGDDPSHPMVEEEEDQPADMKPASLMHGTMVPHVESHQQNIDECSECMDEVQHADSQQQLNLGQIILMQPIEGQSKIPQEPLPHVEDSQVVMRDIEKIRACKPFMHNNMWDGKPAHLRALAGYY